MGDLEYTQFQRKVLDITGIDLSQYKSEQMRRRLNTIMARSGAQNLFEYSRILAQDAVRRQQFRDFITINVSEFFRIPDRFEYLQRQVLPAMLAKTRRLNIWSAGCSNGAEPYTLAIILSELAPLGQWRILATDVDATILDHAREGVYTAADIQNVRRDMVSKYFVSVGGQDRAAYRVTDTIRQRVQFKRHDLLRDGYDSGFDLILCRHVLIYFTEGAKDDIFRRFQQSLRPGGFLFIGGTEMIKRPQEIGFETMSVSFYRKSA